MLKRCCTVLISITPHPVWSVDVWRLNHTISYDLTCKDVYWTILQPTVYVQVELSVPNQGIVLPLCNKVEGKGVEDVKHLHSALPERHLASFICIILQNSKNIFDVNSCSIWTFLLFGVVLPTYKLLMQQTRMGSLTGFPLCDSGWEPWVGLSFLLLIDSLLSFQ